MYLSLLAFLYIGVLIVGSLNLPSYIPKCSLSDPHLGKCIVESGNAAIPRLVKGDTKLAVPSISPLSYSSFTDNDNLNLIWGKVYTDSLKNFRLTNASFDLRPNRTSFYEVYLNHYFVTIADYTMTGGKIVGIPVYGSGSANITFVGFTIRVSGTMSTYKRNGETYTNAALNEVHSCISRGYYYFENIQSPCVDDVNAYIEENWETFTQAMIPTLNVHFGAVLDHALHTITTKVPLNKMFLP